MSDDPFLRFLQTRNRAKVAREWTSSRLVDVVSEAEPPAARVPAGVVMLEKKLFEAEALLVEEQRVQWRREAERLGGVYVKQRARLVSAEAKVEELRGILAALQRKREAA